MKRIRWIHVGLIVVILLLTAVSVSILAFNRPIGPSLDLEDPGTAIAQDLPTAIPSLDIPTATPPPDHPTPTSPGITDTSGEIASACGQAGRVNLLMLGRNPLERFPRGADAIRLMVVDYDRPAIQILAMPPDLWVETTRLEGVDAATLTDAFGLAEEAFPPGDPDGVTHAIGVVAQALLDNFGYHTDKYLTLDQSAFKGLIDAVGSIEVFVPEAVDGAPDGYGFYVAGLQAMDGQRALDYVRLLQPAGKPTDEWARFERQNQVIKGIRNEILKPENWKQISNFVNDFSDLFVTNLNPRELLSLNCMIDEVGSRVDLLEITPLMITPSSDGVLLPDENAVRELIAELTIAN